MVGQTATNFEWAIENRLEIERILNNAAKKISDLRIPFRIIASDFYRSQRKLFTLKSKGLYQDLAPAVGQDGNPTTTSNYKKQKTSLWGYAYPILRASGVLERSVTTRNAANSHFVLAKQTLEMGTTDPIAKYHQSDQPRTKIPLRKIIFIDGGPADRSKDASISGRRERWANIIETHVNQVISGRI